MKTHQVPTEYQTRGPRTRYADGESTVSPTSRPNVGQYLDPALIVVLMIALTFAAIMAGSNPVVQDIVAHLVRGG